MLGSIQYASNHTDQKFDSYLSDESQTRYVLGRMQYAPTDTDKNLIPLCTMNLKLGTCWGVCNTRLPVPDKYLRNMYLSNPIPGKE